MTINKENSIKFVIEIFGFATKANIIEAIEALNFEIHTVLNIENPKDLPYIEANLCYIGFLYSALKDMRFQSNDLPICLN